MKYYALTRRPTRGDVVSAEPVKTARERLKRKRAQSAFFHSLTPTPPQTTVFGAAGLNRQHVYNLRILHVRLVVSTHLVHPVLVAREWFKRTTERRTAPSNTKGERLRVRKVLRERRAELQKLLYLIRLWCIRNIRICSIYVTMFCAFASHTAISCQQTDFSDCRHPSSWSPPHRRFSPRHVLDYFRLLGNNKQGPTHFKKKL